jgi:hypothetical protein
MAFDKDAFLAAFLGRVTTGIEERREEAKDYEKEAKDAADRNAALVQQRTMRAQQAAQIGRRAIALGASEAQVRTAMSSGMTGITELNQKLQEAVEQKGVKTLGDADIEAIINMPSIPAVNTEMMDGSLDDFAKRTYGAMPIQRAAVEDDTNIVGRLFGFGAMDRTKQKLAETDYMGGMTVADINAMSKQAEYQQLIGGAYMTFADVDYFTAEAALDFNTKITKAMSDAVGSSAGKEYIKRARSNAIDNGEDPNVAAQTAEQYLQTTAAKPLIDYFAETYYAGGFFNNKLATQQIKTVMGETYLNDLMELYATEAPDEEEIAQQEEDTVSVDENETEVLAEPVEPVSEDDVKYPKATPLTPAQKEVLKDKFTIGENVDEEVIEFYTREQWNKMSRGTRKRLGLPESKAGGMSKHFRDEVDELLEERNVNMNLKTEGTQGTYKIKIRGRVGSYHVTAEQLASMDDSFFEGFRPDITIETYREGEKPTKKKITTTLVSKFAKRD